MDRIISPNTTPVNRGVPKTFGDIRCGTTFYRKVFDHIHTMVKASPQFAVMFEDAAKSAAGYPTPYWEIDASELMVPEERVEEIRKTNPELIKTSSLDL